MTFYIHSLPADYTSSRCYVRLHFREQDYYSPFYPDQGTAVQHIRQLLLRLRENDGPEKITSRSVFGTQPPAVGAALPIPAGEQASLLPGQLRQEALSASTFPLIYLELADDISGLSELSDLDLQQGDQLYNWREVDETLLHLEADRAGFLRPGAGLQPTAGLKPCEPVFNAFQPHLATDFPLFFGRRTETEEIHELITSHPLLLLYGPDRVGKTSLVQCGLPHRLEAVPGEMVFVRRDRDGLPAALRTALSRELSSLGAGELPEDAAPETLMLELTRQTHRPLYLVFDQLEALFEPEVPEEERQEFFRLLHQWLHSDLPDCRLLLVLRESWLAHLAEYEEELPELLRHRYRLQPLKQSSVVDLSINLFDVLQLQGLLRVEEPVDFTTEICRQLANEQGEVPLQCLQIYLHELQQAGCRKSNGQPPLLDRELIESMGPARDVIDNHLLRRMAGEKEKWKDQPARQQQQLQELERSRQDCGCASRPLPVAAAAAVPAAVSASSPGRMRWALLLALLGLLLSLLGFWWLYNWSMQQTPCHIAREADSCEALVDYLCRYGEEAECAPEFRERLAGSNCELWTDYKLLISSRTCGSYQNFLQKYGDTDICTDLVRKRLLEWGCPLLRDTVEITLRDTIIQPPPAGYESTSGRISTTARSAPPPCRTVQGIRFKSVGPLWIMTDALSGGPYSWEDALDACSARGWRLPCVGEIDFLLENIYRGRGERAYAMLTGTGPCYLASPAEARNGRIEFWTATEADDGRAWSFYFDTSAGTLDTRSGTPKTSRLPCLCVQRDQDSPTAMPPCYQKNIERGNR